MSVRTYRVQVSGLFDRPEPAVRARLLAEQPQHDVFSSGFTAEGTFTYAPTITRFTLRYLIETEAGSAVEADELAALEGEVRAERFLADRQIPVKALSVSITCLDDVKRR